MSNLRFSVWNRIAIIRNDFWNIYSIVTVDFVEFLNQNKRKFTHIFRKLEEKYLSKVETKNTFLSKNSLTEYCQQQSTLMVFTMLRIKVQANTTNEQILTIGEKQRKD